MNATTKVWKIKGKINLVLEAAKVMALANLAMDPEIEFKDFDGTFPEWVKKEMEIGLAALCSEGLQEDEAKQIINTEFANSADYLCDGGCKRWVASLQSAYPGVFDCNSANRTMFAHLYRQRPFKVGTTQKA